MWLAHHKSDSPLLISAASQRGCVGAWSYFFLPKMEVMDLIFLCKVRRGVGIVGRAGDAYGHPGSVSRSAASTIVETWGLKKRCSSI